MLSVSLPTHFSMVSHVGLLSQFLLGKCSFDSQHLSNETCPSPKLLNQKSNCSVATLMYISKMLWMGARILLCGD